MSDVIGVWSEREQRLLLSHPPKLKRNLIGSHTPLGEVPPEWLAEVEWRVSRPLGFDGCWYLATRRRSASVRRSDDQQWTFKSNPQMRVMEFVAGVGWKNEVVRARPWIAQMFYEWDGIEDPASGFVSGFKRADTGTEVRFEKPRSHWQVTMACKDDRCINPAHMTFQPSGGKNEPVQPDKINIQKVRP